MNRRGQAVVMLLVGLAVLQASLTDVYLRFVRTGLRPFLIAGGLLLVANAVMTLWYQRRRDPAHADPLPDHTGGDFRADGVDGGYDHDSHHHGHGEPRVAWLLLAPVAVLALVAPPALGADAAGRVGTALQQPSSDFDPLPPGDPVAISLREYASRAVFDQGHSLADRSVRVIGFIVVGEDGTTYLARMIVSCCAADARPIKVVLSGEVPKGLTPDTWLSVTGRYDARTIQDPVNGGSIPYLEVEEAQQIPQPRSPYQV